MTQTQTETEIQGLCGLVLMFVPVLDWMSEMSDLAQICKNGGQTVVSLTELPVTMDIRYFKQNFLFPRSKTGIFLLKIGKYII